MSIIIDEKQAIADLKVLFGTWLPTTLPAPEVLTRAPQVVTMRDPGVVAGLPADLVKLWSRYLKDPATTCAAITDATVQAAYLSFAPAKKTKTVAAPTPAPVATLPAPAAPAAAPTVVTPTPSPAPTPTVATPAPGGTATTTTTTVVNTPPAPGSQPVASTSTSTPAAHGSEGNQRPQVRTRTPEQVANGVREIKVAQRGRTERNTVAPVGPSGADILAKGVADNMGKILATVVVMVILLIYSCHKPEPTTTTPPAPPAPQTTAQQVVDPNPSQATEEEGTVIAEKTEACLRTRMTYKQCAYSFRKAGMVPPDEDDYNTRLAEAKAKK